MEGLEKAAGIHNTMMGWRIGRLRVPTTQTLNPSSDKFHRPDAVFTLKNCNFKPSLSVKISNQLQPLHLM
jgi:hypothetical protein